MSSRRFGAALAPSTHRPWLVALVLSALLSTQWLALLHDLGHANGRLSDGPGAVSASSSSPGVLRSVVEAASDHIEGAALCQLFQQLAQPAPPAMVVVQALERESFPEPSLAPSGGRTAPPVDAYRARAPPLQA
ncbi:hypothetical protein AACH06_10890 [Ideonella sp. DXS29W]|uniref:DUF2946 domain-containing protein n=1 Tax=Ideonella lacteola TaxID=2984193 RepID=A0ABU9BNI4_9BURK